MTDAINTTSEQVDSSVDEFDLAGLEMVAGKTVRCPRVAGVPAALECKTTAIVPLQTLEGEEAFYRLVIGQVTGIFIDDKFVTEGRFDLAKANPILRAGYRDYATIGDLFELTRPDD